MIWRTILRRKENRMSDFERAKSLLEQYRWEKNAALSEVAKLLDLEEDDDVEGELLDSIDDFELTKYCITVNDYTDVIDNLEDLVEILKSPEAISAHNAKKGLEVVVSDLRKIKKEKSEEIAKAQALVDSIDEIIGICDRNRG